MKDISHIFISAPGYPGGDCSTTSCIDPNSECIDDLCECNTGYRSIDTRCMKGEDVKCSTSWAWFIRNCSWGLHIELRGRCLLYFGDACIMISLWTWTTFIPPQKCIFQEITKIKLFLFFILHHYFIADMQWYRHWILIGP